ncbi:MAG: ATP-binding protein, partial [Gammaproteobacteria bacterium]|nr:ATP-binding protein [Gammaproteobacteria bacterium]
MSQKQSELTQFGALLDQAESLLQRVAQLLPDAPPTNDWSSPAYRWNADPGRPGRGHLQPLRRPHETRLNDLLGIERPKQALVRNTHQFLAGQPANHALLWGPRGTGKSSLVKALLTAFQPQGLRLIEVDKDHLVDLSTIAAEISDQREKFIIFCDDLAFDPGDASYRPLKVALDGSLSGPQDNLLIYATSNRRHLLPEYMEENQATQHRGSEIHFSETVEETISLSERFGLWLAFHPFNQDQYLAAVKHWLGQLNGLPPEQHWPACRELALCWALQRGSRSGRSAHQ